MILFLKNINNYDDDNDHYFVMLLQLDLIDEQVIQKQYH